MEWWLVVCVSDEQRNGSPSCTTKEKAPGGYLSAIVSKHIASTLSSMQKDNSRLQALWKFPGLQLEQLWLRTLPEILASVLSGLRHPKPGRIKLCTSISVPTDSSLEKTIWNWWSCGILCPWSPISMGLLKHHSSSNEMLACFPTLWNGNLKHFPLN